MNERLRLETLITREGMERAKQWAEGTAAVYRASINDPGHYASQTDWKPFFEKSIHTFTRFADTGMLPPALPREG